MYNNKLAVEWYVPNIIGYIRVILVLMCLFISSDHPYLLISLLIIAGLLDNLDGFAARHLNQGSRFGVVLDYLTDRITTVVYVKILTLLLPTYANIFYILFMIDMASHMGRLYLTSWANGVSHKEIKSEFKLLNLYYPRKSFSPMMAFCTHSYELFFISLILLFSTASLEIPIWLLWSVFVVSIPGFVTKNIVHTLQLIECFKTCKSFSQANSI